MSFDKYVDSITNRQSATEHIAEQNLKQVQKKVELLLDNPKERNPVIWDWFLTSGISKSNGDMDVEASRQLWYNVADLVDLKFDELNKTPLHLRSQAWEIASSVMLSSSVRQAQIESGLTQQAMIDGVDNATDLNVAKKDLNKEDLQALNLEIKKEMKKKKKDLKNG